MLKSSRIRLEGADWRAPSEFEGSQGESLELRPAEKPSPREEAPTARVIRGEFRALGALSILVGALLLLEQAGFLPGVHLLWPVFPAFIGLGLVILFFERGRRDLLLLGIGAYLLAASIVFFICNYTSWAPLAQAWPVFIAIFGVISTLAAPFAHRIRNVLLSSGLFLIIVAAVFFLVFQVDARLWPVSLVLLGTWILVVTWAGQSIGKNHV